MTDKTAEKREKVADPVPPADSLIKTSKDATVELSEDELAKVTGGVKTISWSQE